MPAKAGSAGALVFRRPALQRALAAGGFVMGVVFAESAVGSNAAAQDGLTRWLATVFFALLSPVCVWLAVRILRAGILVGKDGVTFRNFVRTRHALWSDIERFDPPGRYGALRNTGLRARMRSGTTTYSSVFAPGPFTRPGFADHVVESLNAIMGAHTGA